MKNNKIKASPVSWLVKEISRDRVGRAIITTFLKEFEQAKEMEKQQIIDAITIGFDEGRSYMHNGTTKFETGLQFYNEIYGGQNNEQ
jgi:hypothetical protein